MPGGARRPRARRAEDQLENALLAARVPWDGDELPLRTAQARLATEPDYRRRDGLGAAVLEVSAGFNDERRSLLAARDELEAAATGIDDPVARNEAEKRVPLRPIADAVDTARVEGTTTFNPSRERWLDRLLGTDRDDVPSSAHMAWIRRLSPLEATYTKERSVPVCLSTLRAMGFDLEAEKGIRPDLEDRPQKAPRACVIPTDPPRLVHLITRAQGGLHDYEAFLHEAGHALHYAGCDPGLPLAFRRLARDHALTEIYSFLLDSVAREPGWHAEHFGLDDRQARENADAAAFSNAILFRRYSAKLGFELEFWGRFRADGGTPGGYEERLTAATGIRYPAANHLADMDAGFYSAEVEEVMARLADIQAEMGRRAALEGTRTAILTTAGSVLGIPPHTVTIESLADLLAPAQATVALERSAELRGLLAEVAREHAINRVLMRQELAFLDHLMRELGAEPDTTWATATSPRA